MIFVLGGGAVSVAKTEQASPWQASTHSRIRLIAAGGIPYQGRLVMAAALEIVLDDGWKTYWRTPGDGLAPSFEWNGSRNLKNAAMLWPAPRRLVNPGGSLAYGYERRLVLPIVITPLDAGAPVLFRLRAAYGVCADICISAEADLELEIPSSVGGGAFGKDIAAALERVPKQQARGVYCPHRVITAKRRTVNGRPALLVKTAFDERAAGLDLLAEGPDGFELPVPERQPRSSRGRAHYILDFETAEAVEGLKQQTLILTTVADQGSCEIDWHVE
jgi:DsbC/DsbD-like thiol-disulfide interchange protein